MAVTEPVTCATCELHAEAIFRVEGMETGMRMWLEHEEPMSTGADAVWRWRLVVCGAVAVAAGLAFSMSGRPGIGAIFYIAAAVAGGIFPARRALTSLRSRAVDINTLMVIAVAGALALGDWLEAASVVLLFAVAQWLEVRTLERARQAIRTLIDLSPREALVIAGGREQRVPVGAVRVGDEILVKPGEKLPLDGVVLAGHSDVNEAPLTGESLPVDKAPGHDVYAGTINGRGALDVRVTRLVRDTRLAQIIHLVETAQASRAPVQSFVDRFARTYTPVVIALALLVAVGPPLAGAADPAAWIYRALVLLVIACPCALVISTPVSFVAALSAAAKNGVLVKGGAYLERLAAVRVVAFDKTGTLTLGQMQVAAVWPIAPLSETDLLMYAASVEARSEHPFARAIADYAATRIAAPTAVRFASVPGMGAEAEVNGRNIVIGNERLLVSRGIAAPPQTPPEAFALVTDGAHRPSLVFVAVDGVLAGAIALADRPRDTAREAIGMLREQGVQRVALLTGDRADTARAVAAELRVDEFHAGLLPDQKHELVRTLRDQYGPVLMVGDGVNDAPALAAADVGVAMGAAGSDVALETADVALMSDELLKLPYAIRLARATLWNVRTNVAISLALKAAFLVLAVTGGATLWMAVLADTGASVIVVGNALRLLRTR